MDISVLVLEALGIQTGDFFDGLLPFVFRFSLNLFFTWFLIARVYYRVNRQREYLFSFFAVSVLIFVVASVLADIKVKTGFGFGLFAIFSILRYRTEQIGIKEMTFLFACAILAVVNSMVTLTVPFQQIVFGNIAIITVLYFLEKIWLRIHNTMKIITYDKIELVHENRMKELEDDISLRTGLMVRYIDVLSINLLRDTAEIAVYYEDRKGKQP
ncbi:MAG: DUF4956 domain-containing protein [Fibrobacterota bacterium]